MPRQLASSKSCPDLTGVTGGNKNGKVRLVRKMAGQATGTNNLYEMHSARARSNITTATSISLMFEALRCGQLRVVVAAKPRGQAKKGRLI